MINLTELRKMSQPDVPYSEAAAYLRKHGEEIAEWIALVKEIGMELIMTADAIMECNSDCDCPCCELFDLFAEAKEK